MVFRLTKRHAALLAAAVITLLFLIPYETSDLLSLEHDTLFHLSRIQGLAEAIGRGDLLPALYPYKNNGFGYASPLFYCDLLLYPFSLLYHFGCPLSVSYKLLIFCVTLFSTWAMIHLIQRISGSQWTAFAAGAAFCFSNYRITDVYVRGALGEVMAMGFLILCIEGLYLLLEESRTSAWKKLFFGMLGMVFSHNLTFLLGMAVLALIVLLEWKQLDKERFAALLKACICAFLCSCWFTLPMIEQLHSQKFILHYYAASSQLEYYALPLWKYFANTTVFGYGNNNIEPARQMLVNPGIGITLFSLLFPCLYIRKKDVSHARFLWICWGIGIACFLLPWDIFPWASMSFLRVLQFPWRLMTPALILLCIPASAVLQSLSRQQTVPAVLALVLLIGEGIWHLIPATERTFGITSATAYEDIISGALIDPYYSADYMRVELAGGDYLPVDSPDFRGLTPAVWNSSGAVFPASYVQNGTTLTIKLEEVPSDGFLELPLTWYKGYTCNAGETAVSIGPSSRALASVRVSSPCILTVSYQGTLLRTVCIAVSGLSVIGILILLLLETKKENCLPA